MTKTNYYKLGDVYLDATTNYIYVVVGKRIRGSEFVAQLRIDTELGDVYTCNHTHAGIQSTETYLGNALRRNKQKNGSLLSKTR